MKKLILLCSSVITLFTIMLFSIPQTTVTFQMAGIITVAYFIICGFLLGSDKSKCSSKKKELPKEDSKDLDKKK